MRVTLNLVDHTTVVTDVVFPIFRRNDLDNCTIYTMVVDPSTQWSITVALDGKSYEIELEKPSWFASAEYLMGLGVYSSKASQFADAREKALKFLQGVPSQVSIP